MKNNNYLVYLSKFFLYAILSVLSAGVIMGIVYFLIFWLFNTKVLAIFLSIIVGIIYSIGLIAIRVDDGE